MGKMESGSVTSDLIINCYIVCWSASLCSHFNRYHHWHGIQWTHSCTSPSFRSFYVQFHNKHFIFWRSANMFGWHTRLFDGVRWKYFIKIDKIVLRMRRYKTSHGWYCEKISSEIISMKRNTLFKWKPINWFQDTVSLDSYTFLRNPKKTIWK